MKYSEAVELLIQAARDSGCKYKLFMHSERGFTFCRCPGVYVSYAGEIYCGTTKIERDDRGRIVKVSFVENDIEASDDCKSEIQEVVCYI